MPLYNIYHPVGAYTAEDKAEFAKRIVDTYGDSIPRFYVGVIFHEIAKDEFYMGAVARDNFVRLRCDHFARHHVAEANGKLTADEWMTKIEASIAPFVRDRGYDWEIHYGETPRELWRVQGMVPPAAHSDLEKQWIKENRAVPYDQ
jgi:phenylpyruvate tautomerase PptA (4-oxalocrotonate tautomerase family)